MIYLFRVILLNNLIEKLLCALNSVSDEQDSTAAIALLLRPVDDDVEILFVKRVRNPQDPWSGQIALPGGKRDPGDCTLKETVTREIKEEVGIVLDECQLLGVLKAIVSAPRPEMKILPFVIYCGHEPSITLNEKELEGFFWVSLKELVRHKGTVTFWFGEFPAYVLEENVIWGLTFRIVEMVVCILNGKGYEEQGF